MVTRAGKDLLKNTIRSTDYHNKLLQEDDMWRQWEIEKGLTMMVTDDCLRNRLRMDSCKSSDSKRLRLADTKSLQKQKEAARDSRRGNYWSRKLMEAEDNDPDRWGHSGYKELYPEEFKTRSLSKSSTSSTDHTSRHKHKSRKKKHKRIKKTNHKKKQKQDVKMCATTTTRQSSSEEKETEDSESDVDVYPSLSEISARDLARRREYLKRKLEKFSKESSLSADNNDEESPPKNSKRLQSRVVSGHRKSQKTAKPTRN